ncbi:hypothetical protein CTEN210_01341 [Chaetoceros tenuissimus]|uniref:Transmembrane protein n=1 Tax=Chaetoceros tenuissimus TaxID=426638 RepID=A0AAD3GZA9_9STRA|nr:hypothetical protein CTEN210_01341 [Chaetoceros tenuissimus]
MNELQWSLLKPLSVPFKDFVPYSTDAGEEVRDEEGQHYSLKLQQWLESSMQSFAGRCKLFSVVLVLVAFFLMIPILICVKIDGILSGSESALAQADWMVVLSPLIAFEILHCLVHLSVGAIVLAIRCGSVLALEILLALKWDGSVDYRYSVILIPLFINQILYIFREVRAEVCICRLIFVVLLALQLDQDRGWDWNIVLIPIWIEVIVGQLYACCYDPETGKEEPIKPTASIIITLALFSFKIDEATDGDEKNGFSCLWILFPLFFYAFIILLMAMTLFLVENEGAEDDRGIVSDNLRAREDKAKKEEEEVKFPITLDKAEEEKSDLEANKDTLEISAGVDEAEKDEEEVKSPIALEKEEEKSDLEANNNANMDDRD